MKISDFQLINQEVDERNLVLDTFNDTKTDYPNDKSIDELVEEIALSYPEALAVSSPDGQKLPYSELREKANRLANFLIDKGLKKEEPVAVLFRPSADMIIALVAVLKAGGAYLPLNESFPDERNRFILKDTGARFLISERRYINTLNRLQWECPELSYLLCLDSEDVLSEVEQANELSTRELWDYVGEEATDDIGAGGWVDSYTGENLSRQVMDEYGDNILIKLRPLLTKEMRVLEIGCSSGISMFRLAPLVREYYGTDLSSEILKKTEAERQRLGQGNIILNVCPAHEVSDLDIGKFDLVIINSVIQCFNGHNYLRDILGKALDMLNDEGMIFIGDIMDQDCKQEMIDSLVAFKNEHAGKGYTTKTDWSNEMFISRSFLEDFSLDHPEITDVLHSEKVGTAKSELTEFRYDTLLKINKDQPRDTSGLAKKKHQLSRRDIDVYPAQSPETITGPDSLAYITYTSGTTGYPKGVMIEHRSVVRLVRNNNYLTIDAEDTLVHAAPLSFDASTFEIWGALLNGATICPVHKDLLLDYKAFDEALEKTGITIGWFTSSLFNNIIDLYPSILRHYRVLLIGGDVLSVTHVGKAIEDYPDLTLINGYGPTENTTFSTTHAISLQDLSDAIPIGKPVANSRCYVLKESNPDHVLPVGIPGELYLAGDGLARGYLNDEQLTAEKFISPANLNEDRLYRTGDRAKWLEDGSIQFLGRVDEQVKIRGHRIELKEIEYRLEELAEVSEVVVLALSPEGGEKQMVAYLVLTDPELLENVKGQLATQLPEYMMPAHFAVLESLPLNSNGKVDRKALPDVFAEDFDSEKATPRGHTEEKLLDIWKEILEVRSMGINDNFFQVGGHSLKATQVISRVLNDLHVKISIRELFTNPTVAGISRLIEGRKLAEMVEIERVPDSDHYPLSYAQKRLWILDRMSSDQIAYNMPGMYRLQNVDIELLKEALHNVVSRHEILRTTFITEGEEPRQKIHDPEQFPFSISEIDLREVADNQEALEKLAQEEARTAFDLVNGPLFRVKVIQLTDNEFALLYTIHHIISDGWSMGLMVNELLQYYEASVRGTEQKLPDLPIQYRDYAVWQSGQLSGNRLDDHKAYWTDKLRVPASPLQMPADYKRPEVQTFEGGLVDFDLPEDVSHAFLSMCDKHQVTLYIGFLSVVRVLLHKYTGQTDMTLGSPVSGRVHPDLQNLIGFFVNMLVLRGQVKPDMSFTDYLAMVRSDMLEAYEHEVYPYDELIRDLNIPREVSRNPLFDIVVTADVNRFAYTGEDSSKHSNGGTTVTDGGIDFNIGSKFDLMIRLIRTGEQSLKLHIRYNSNLYKRDTVLLMKERLVHLMKDASGNPDQSIGQFQLHSAQQSDIKKATAGFNF
ncbi:MAG: condensation domain-containing protein [Cyclobacteriaceae bacterium]